MNIIPSTQTKDFTGDIFSAILRDRIVFLEGEITSASATIIIAELLYLSAQNDNVVQLYINSPGGQVDAALAVYDVMQHIKCPVYTICAGVAASAAAVILSGGSRKFAFENSNLLLHQPWSTGLQGQETDIRIASEELTKKRKILNEILAKNCKKPLEIIEADTERDFYLSAKEAVSYGLIDEILS